MTDVIKAVYLINIQYMACFSHYNWYHRYNKPNSGLKIIMKSKWVLLLTAMSISSNVLFAQAVSPDSMSALNTEKDRLKIEQSLNENKMELAKLQNLEDERNGKVNKTTIDAQNAASSNQDAANTLSDDSKNRKKAKAAHKAANNAENSASDARKASGKLDDLHKEMDDLRKKIMEDEQKIMIIDSTRHN